MIDIDLNDVEKIIIKKKQEGISFKEAAEKVNAEKVDSEYIPLKPCPFCGGKAEIIVSLDSDYYKYKVICSMCGIATLREHIKERAISTWNNREEIKKCV